MTCFSTYFMKPGMKCFLWGVLSADSRHMLLLENLGTDLTGDPWSNEGREHGWSWEKKAPGDLWSRNVFRRWRTCEARDQMWALRFKVAALNVTVELFWAAGQSTESRHSPRSMLQPSPPMQWMVHMSTQRLTSDSARVSTQIQVLG